MEDVVAPIPLRRDSRDQEDDSPPEREDKDESEYMLKWNEHNSQLITVFHQLCQDNQFTDVTLATETESFQAHKLILSACSPYFKKLFTQNPCKHPVVFLKDIPESHMKLLLEYMYRGSISVKHHELQEILNTASSLKIRGLTTAEAPPSDISDTPRPLIVDEHPNSRPYSPVLSTAPSTNQTEPDKFQHIETGSSTSATSGRSGSHSRKGDGRKSSAPKKLRLSGDQDSDISSPRHPPSLSLQEHIVAGDERRTSPDTEQHIHRNSFSISPSDHDNIAVSEEEDLEIAEQPVDFSKSSNGPLGSGSTPYSILGSYLKTGRSSSPEDDHRNNSAYDSLRRNSELSSGLSQAWMAPLANFGRTNPRPASRDSRGDSREDRDGDREGGDSDREGVDPSTPINSLKNTLGIDIADRLRSHFLANLPTQSYAWLNGMQGLGGKGSGMMPSDPSSHLSNGGMLDSRVGDALKLEKNPVGGINSNSTLNCRTGEIGANGKPAVACEVCGKKLADPSSLYRHRKIHSGDKPHKCPHCPRRFIQRYNMKQHIKTHRIQQLDDMKEEPGMDEQTSLHAGLKNLPAFMQEQGLNMTQ